MRSKYTQVLLGSGILGVGIQLVPHLVETLPRLAEQLADLDMNDMNAIGVFWIVVYLISVSYTHLTLPTTPYV